MTAPFQPRAEPHPPIGTSLPTSSKLAAQQAQLVAALTTGAPGPECIDPVRLAIAVKALLRKRADEVGRRWPLLAAALGPDWHRLFAAWAKNRPTRGSLRDGWDFARHLQAAGQLPAMSLPELAGVEVRWRHLGEEPPRSRRFALRRFPGGWYLNIGGRVRLLGSHR